MTLLLNVLIFIDSPTFTSLGLLDEVQHAAIFVTKSLSMLYFNWIMHQIVFRVWRRGSWTNQYDLLNIIIEVCCLI